MTQIHCRKVYETVIELRNTIELAIAGEDEKKVRQRQKMISDLEREADRIRRDIHQLLTRGSELPSSERLDLVQLVSNLDSVANTANGAGRRLVILKEISKFPRKILDALSVMVKDIIECVDLLRECVVSLGGDINQTIKYTDEINEKEFCVDEDLRNILTLLSQEKFSIDPFTAIIFFEFISFLEGIADSCEETADFVRLVSLKIPPT